MEEKTADVSACGTFRYKLGTVWDKTKPSALFVMLNPSKADADIDDPTIRRCRGFAKSFGCGGFMVVNLFAFRATDPQDLLMLVQSGGDAVGPGNHRAIMEAVQAHDKPGDLIIAAWGSHGSKKPLRVRVAETLRQLPTGRVLCLTKTKDGQPSHPLMLAANLTPVAFGGSE